MFSLKPFIRDVIFKYFLTVCGLSFLSLNSVFCREISNILVMSNLLIVSFMGFAVGAISKKLKTNFTV